MSHRSNLMLICCASLLLWPYVGKAEGVPSAGARGLPGAKGTFEFKPDDWRPDASTWWKDTDGVDPGTAGCHIGTDQAGNPNGRTFGEACLPDGLLVESNPGASVIHQHIGDIGRPDTFDCQAWCIGMGSSTGVCSPAVAPPCVQSAACKCD